MMQIQPHPIEQHGDPVPAARDILGVQRLVHVANKVDHELGRDGALAGRQVRVEQAVRVVGQGAHDAARVLLAVALVVDAAVARGRVLGVDEVEVLGEAAPLAVAHRVSPGRDAGEVVARVVAQQVLQEERRVGGDKVGGDVADCDVSEAWLCGEYN